MQDFSSAWLCCQTVPSNEVDLNCSGENPCGQQPTYLLQFSKQTPWLGSCKYNVKGLLSSQSKQTKKILAKKPLNHKSFPRTPLEVAAYCFWCATPLSKLMISQVWTFRSYHLHPPILSGLEEFHKNTTSYHSGLQTASHHPFNKAAQN